jgi:protein MpaA
MKFISLPAGRSVQDREIPVFRSEVKASRWLYLMAGTHGDEPESLYVLDKLWTWLKKTELPTLPLIIIPNLNPDGALSGTRVNARGVDLNRNYPASNWQNHASEKKYFPGPFPLSEPENRFLIDVFDHYPPLEILSFHSWKPILNYTGTAQGLAEFIAEFNHYQCCDSIGYPTPGSLGSFLPEAYNAGILTFECPEIKHKPLEEIWAENEAGLKAVFTEYWPKRV